MYRLNQELLNSVKGAGSESIQSTVAKECKKYPNSTVTVTKTQKGGPNVVVWGKTATVTTTVKVNCSDYNAQKKAAKKKG